MLTPSAAVNSGFSRVTPPPDKKLPGVTGVPSASKKTCLGPSEQNHSTGSFAPPENGCGYEKPAFAAATAIAFVAAACPTIAPGVAVER